MDMEAEKNNDVGMFSRLKPDSATQLQGDLYIGTRDEDGGVFGSRKRS